MSLDLCCDEPSIEPFIIAEDLCCNINFELCGEVEETAVDEIIQNAIDAASLHIHRLSGAVYGIKKERWVPCSGVPCWCSSDKGTCGCPFYALELDSCVSSVDAIYINGVEQSLSEYGLMRLEGQTLLNSKLGPWPTSQCLTTPEWWIDVSVGKCPDIGARNAVSALACEFLYSCTEPEKCALPAGTTSISRQGLSVEISDSSELFNDGLTGITRVDQWLKAVNPAGASKPPRVLGSYATRADCCTPSFVKSCLPPPDMP